MAVSRPQVHCELGPVLVNRTAVYKMCRETPAQLEQRGFEVNCTAMLARVSPGVLPPSTLLEGRLFAFSQRILNWAGRRPGIWNRGRSLTGQFLRWRRKGRVSLFMDPLYFLFFNGADHGAVIVYDITPATHPHWHIPGISYLYRQAFDLLARSSCQVIAASQCTADQLRMNWGITSSRLSVAYLAFFPEDFAFAPVDVGNAEPYLLFVGSVEPRKNVGGLIDAYDRAQVYARYGVRLKIIGAMPGDDHPVIRHARSIPGVDLLGFVDAPALAGAYRHCHAFVYPSCCEGFGIPLLEAMHQGCVCLATNMGASPEVAGNAALYVNPYSTTDIARGLRRLLELSPAQRSTLSRLARERAESFSWPRFYDWVAAILYQECDKAQSRSARKTNRCPT